MKTISIILGLLIGNITVTMAQQTDSIVVTYIDQHITIPLPSFGKQTTIKMADSLQLIEISISRREMSDISKQTLYPVNAVLLQNPKNKAKWFSQVEVGYTLSLPYSDRYFYQERVIFQGYKISLSVREKARSISSKTSLVTGLKLGYEQSFRNVDVQFVGGEPVIRSSFFQMLFPIVGKQQITAFGLPANVNFGANFIVGYSFITRKNNFNTESVYDNGLFFLEPYIGFEINKFGLRAGSSRNLSPEMSFNNPVKSVNSVSITYRFH